MEAAAILQDTVQASPDSAAVSGKIPELSSDCSNVLRRKRSFRKQFKFLIQLQYPGNI